MSEINALLDDIVSDGSLKSNSEKKQMKFELKMTTKKKLKDYKQFSLGSRQDLNNDDDDELDEEDKKDEKVD